MNSHCDIKPLSQSLLAYNARPSTKIYHRRVCGTASREQFPYVINLQGVVGYLTCVEYCKRNLEQNFAVSNTSWSSINVFVQSVADAEIVTKHFDYNVNYVKGPIKQFHIECLQDPRITICEKLGEYFGEYDCKLELYNWPFSWRELGKTREAVEFLKENCTEFKMVSYLWGSSVYMKHQEFAKIQPFLSLSLGDADFDKSHRVTVRITH